MNRACYFLTHSFAEASQLNGSAISSEVFPLVATNLFDQYKRSKKWRSAGYFKVPEYSKIVLEESGTPITVTITENEFSTRTAFLDHVESCINDASSLTYALSVDPITNKTLMASSAVFSIISTDPDSNLCEYLGFSSAADLTGEDEYLADTVVIHTEEFFIFDLGVQAKPKAMVLIGERGKDLNLTSFAEVYIEANDSNVWDSPAYSEQIAIGKKAVSLARKEGLSDVGYRFWRIVIRDPGNPDGFIEFNKLYLGDTYSPEKGAVQFPFQGDLDEKSTIDESEYGERFSIERRMSERFSLDWDGLTYEENERIVSFFESLGRAKPLFMIYDGNGAFSANSNHYCRFVYFDGSPRYRLTSPGVFEMTTVFAEVP